MLIEKGKALRIIAIESKLECSVVFTVKNVETNGVQITREKK